MQISQTLRMKLLFFMCRHKKNMRRGSSGSKRRKISFCGKMHINLILSFFYFSFFDANFLHSFIFFFSFLYLFSWKKNCIVDDHRNFYKKKINRSACLSTICTSNNSHYLFRFEAKNDLKKGMKFLFVPIFFAKIKFHHHHRDRRKQVL
jgi:hypothetical protein